MYLPEEAPEAFLRRALDELRGLHERGGGGFELARRRADLVDLVLISLFRETEQRILAGGRFRQSGLAVVALGGYGRRELGPHSDVDLMLLYGEEESDLVEAAATDLFYPLWDAGLELGHGARTVEECLSVAADNLEAETAFLQARFLVGNQELYRDLTDRLRRQILGDGGRDFVSRLLEARDARHERYGASAALLEPHLKEGRGGLRDVHELLWAGLALRGGGGVETLGAAGWLEPEAVARLEAAVDVLLRARAGLQYVAGRRVDRLFLDFQEEVAQLMSERGKPDVAEVMAGITDAAHAVALLTSDAWESVLLDVDLTSNRRPSSLPVDLPVVPDGRRVLLLELLREGYNGLPRLERLSHVGLLSEWLPGWREIRYLGWRDSLHTYTVDGHSFRAAAIAVEMAVSHGPDRTAAALASELALTPHWETVLLACLFHDLGKGVPESDHSEAGAALARAAAQALACRPEVVNDVEFLVREHLLLPDTATRRDLEDEQMLDRVAARVGSRRRLEMLYVLTVADSVATGTASWTPWTSALVQELLFKLGDRLGGMGDSRAEVLASESETCVTVAAPADAAPTDATKVFRRVIPGGPAGDEVIFEVREGQVAGAQELLVSSPVHPGLLTRLSGVLSHHDVNILSAQVEPTEQGLVVRSFQVSDQFEDWIPHERWEGIIRDLRRALEGRLALEFRLAEKASRNLLARPSALRHTAKVVVDNDASDTLTVIEVHTQDRIGLLYSLARTLDDLLLDVRLAKVATLKEKVVDVFYVADCRGEKVTDTEHVRELEKALLFALEAKR
ncbi:MAG TPA: HD domain-containing protein [Thermoleophilia bacterium]|nr:HD domain-containing protein [Thermoleophilia bacterium]